MPPSETRPPAPTKAFYSIADLMERWGVSDATIYRERRRGKLKCKRIAGSIRFAAEEVERYEKVA